MGLKKEKFISDESDSEVQSLLELLKKAGDESDARSYQQSPAERRVDFAAIKKALDDDQVSVDLALRVPIRKVLDDLIGLIKEQDKRGGITDSFVMGLTLTTGPEAQRILGDYLLKVWKRGRELAAKELPEKVSRGIREYACDYCGAIHHHEADVCEHFAFCPTGEGGGIDNSCSPTGEIKRELEPIKTEIRQIQSELNSIPQNLFKEARIVGSWAKQQPDRLPDRRGKGISDLDVILVAADIPAGADTKTRFKLRDIRAKAVERIKKRVQSISKREIEIRESDIVGTDKTIRIFEQETTRRFAGLEPVQAINFFQNLRPWLVKGIIDDDLKKAARLELTEHLKGGRTLTETIGNLRSAWEPWVGDPTKVLPSGVTGTAEDILQAFRLENIVRTEAITALSQGRAAIADEAGDFVVGFELSPILDVDTHLPLSQTRGSLPCNRIRDLIDMDRPVRFRKDDPRAVKLLPPLLYNCRTIEIFITTDDLPVRWSTEAELDSVVRLIPTGFK